MARPRKPIELIRSEGNKLHLTKAEIERREKAEKALLTGVPMREWPEVKETEIAHKGFLRIKKLLKSINHDEALHEPVINRYCLLMAECKAFEDKKPVIICDIGELKVMRDNKEIDQLEYLRQKDKLENLYMTVDRKIMEKRKMMLDIEKENVMTIASALRSIPKKLKDEAEDNPMAKYLKGRNR